MQTEELDRLFLDAVRTYREYSGYLNTEVVAFLRYLFLECMGGEYLAVLAEHNKTYFNATYHPVYPRATLHVGKYEITLNPTKRAAIVLVTDLSTMQSKYVGGPWIMTVDDLNFVPADVLKAAIKKATKDKLTTRLLA